MNRFRPFRPDPDEFRRLELPGNQDRDAFRPGLPVRRLQPACRVDVLVGDRAFRAFPRAVDGPETSDS
ncbi:MAG: hypothetical protein D6794_11545 [Deltaproteobacteria bacterium]|nr:MAG: hypothetical protein D6794_11545 [Deltaproteobacteria bacterium]